MQVVGRAVHVLSSSSPQSYEIQCGFLRLIFFPPKKDLSFVFFLICPRFSHQNPTLNKQTEQDELSWLEYGADGANNSKGVGLIPVWATYSMILVSPFQIRIFCDPVNSKSMFPQLV